MDPLERSVEIFLVSLVFATISGAVMAAFLLRVA